MEKLAKILLLLCSIWFLQGCVSEPSESVDQDKIYATYELYYDKNRDKTFARATFQFSNALGTKLQLSGASEIRFNNDLLTYNSVLAYYEREYAGFLTTGTFKWKDTNGKEYTNTISGIKPVAFPNAMPTFKKGNSTEVFWVGDALISGESAAISMNSPAIGDLQIALRTDVAATSVIVNANQIQNLPTGQNITAILRRYKDVTVAQKTGAGAKMFTHYQAANVTVQINP
ncbi:MAG: hypothetical protein MUE85_16155 [Microscillaceae bacterium]|jgi:hypothetical protein|nr:hypothetical protein [Microscillaceae bacterium]